MMASLIPVKDTTEWHESNKFRTPNALPDSP
jgi:hypothetical protein